MKLDTVHFMHQIRVKSILKTSILNELTELREKQRQVLSSDDDLEDNDMCSQMTKFDLADLDLELMVQADREK